MKSKSKLNSLFVGIITGLIMSLLVFVVNWKMRYDISLGEYIQRYYESGRLISLISLCSIPILLMFYLFIRMEMDKAAKGIIIPAVILVILMVLIRFFL